MKKIKQESNQIRLNGANSWMNVVPNDTFGVTYSNKEFLIILSMYLGTAITNSETKCKKCLETCDKYGIHALQCRHGPQNIERHNKIRDIYNDYFQKA